MRSVNSTASPAARPSSQVHTPRRPNSRGGLPFANPAGSPSSPGMKGGWRPRQPALVAGVALAALVAAPLAWRLTDRLERENEFCTSCHLPDGSPLHRAKGEHFRRLPPATLAGAHAAAGVRGREPVAFLCIDCHGGVGALGRARVKLLSARDAFWYALGRFEEPDAMRWPLWDD